MKCLLLAALAIPAASQATWLDLPDGSYDVTLSCASVSNTLPVSCPSDFHASLTVSGTGASAMSTSFNNQTFAGDPTDAVFTFSVYSSERSVLYDTPFSFIYLANDLAQPNPNGLSDHWWLYCLNYSATTCAVAAEGNWVATAVSPAPEPSTVVMVGLGLAGMALVQRRRRRDPFGAGFAA